MSCNCINCRYNKGLVKKSEYLEYLQNEKKKLEKKYKNGKYEISQIMKFEEVNELLYLLHSEKRVYISGPITTNKEHYKEEFAAAKNFLQKLGYEVINPAEDDYTEEVKESGIEDIWSSDAWLWYIKRDMDIVSNCDAIYMLRNWEKSQGAIIEKATAERCGLQVWYQGNNEVPEYKESEMWKMMNKGE